MKSAPIRSGDHTTGCREYRQQEVARYAVFVEAMAACDKANRKRKARHYVMNALGKEYYANHWID